MKNVSFEIYAQIIPPILFSLTIVSSHMSAVRDLFAHHGNNNTNVLMHEYNIGEFHGYGAKMDDK